MLKENLTRLIFEIVKKSIIPPSIIDIYNKLCSTIGHEQVDIQEVRDIIDELVAIGKCSYTPSRRILLS